MEEIPLEERKKVNFDHPDSLDWELLHEHLVAIAAWTRLRRAGLLIRRLRAHHRRPGASSPRRS